MKILFVAAEAASLAEVGGLAEVVGSLPKALIELGHDVRVMIPCYETIDTGALKLVKESVQLSDFADGETVSIWSARIKQKIPTYLIANQHHFSGREIYGGSEMEKFLFFSKAVADIMPEFDWQPQVIHCHDWHTALVAMWIKKLNLPYKIIFTIHNLAYQGKVDNDFLYRHGLNDYWGSYPSIVPVPMSFLGQGILNSDLLTTVSINYAREITSQGSGEGLDDCLKYKRDSLFGITNGIDYDLYNPGSDKLINHRYTSEALQGKAENKINLQKRVNLPVMSEVPVIGIVQRLEEQKGIDILVSAIYRLINETGMQMVILGRGREIYEDELKKIAQYYSHRVAVFTAYDDTLAHLIYAGSDMFLMPSKFEPCGLGQLIAIRYGTIPVVRHTGGLVDTVPPLSDDMTRGNGFVFHDYSADALVFAIKKAIVAFKDHDSWRKAISRIMKLDFSWNESAKKYIELYEKLI